ncbi:hypothetical protein HMPREF2785_09580 [Corynebacterium sp. HMSC067D03]|nr:hypothetical protein HMPREF2785_09580 [Corynebacterium sp. HMSC067D03]OHO33447.1 hypothetical protein HMPREF2690_06985 [Corynebacterium sp. HMSC034E11]
MVVNVSKMSSRRIPRAVKGGLSEIGEALQRWRRLNRLTIEQAAYRADVSVSTLRRLEQGHGATLENFLRVCRAFQLLDRVKDAVAPMEHGRGRALIEQML